MKAKKITALLMAAVMTVSLAACGSSGATTAEPAADSSTEAKAETCLLYTSQDIAKCFQSSGQVGIDDQKPCGARYAAERRTQDQEMCIRDSRYIEHFSRFKKCVFRKAFQDFPIF